MKVPRRADQPAYALLSGVSVEPPAVLRPDQLFSSPALQALLQHQLLPRLDLRDLACLEATCRATRRLVRRTPDSAGLYQAAARHSGLRNIVVPTRQQALRAAKIHETFKAQHRPPVVM